MGRGEKLLYARRVATVTEPGYYSDGGGLYLQVAKGGTKSWVYRYTTAGKTTDMGLGPLADITLPEAREKAAACRKLRLEGKDPLSHFRAERLALAAIPTFEEASHTYIEANKAAWKSAKHAAQWLSTLERYAFPAIGRKRVDAVNTKDVLAILQPIWTSKTETATRVRQRIEAVLDAEAAKGHRQGENPARWKGHLATMLPNPRKVTPVRHFPALPYSELPAFMDLLRHRPERSAKALEFTIVTVVRTSVTVGGRWQEIVGDLWNVPGARMKSGRDFTVPLSGYAQRILANLHRESEWLFPSDTRPHLTTDSMDALLERMGFSHVTVHGFRSTFKDWAAEQTPFANEVSEAALAHVITDKAEAAYRRGPMLEKRRALMQAWADYCLS